MENPTTTRPNGTFHIAPAHWRSIRTKLRKRYQQLTEADLVLEKDGEAAFIRRLQTRLHLSAVDVRQLINDL